MMKHSIALLVAVATSALAGCQLYFGEENNNGSWNYCGSDGYYECSDDECYWRGPECPAGAGTGSPEGFDCKVDADCAAGCYCENGTCAEAGFCTKDSDCGTGYTCNEERTSCEPTEEPPTVSCVADNDCEIGEYCDSATLKCTATCTCANDAEAKLGGFDYCDESRTTCLPGADPYGDCAGDLETTCTTPRPSCPAGEVALINEGCYTGQCTTIPTCASKPTCGSYQHGADCLADAKCGASSTGINCRKPDNTLCQPGDTNCMCERFEFASCNDAAAPRTVEYNGHKYDISELTLRN